MSDNDLPPLPDLGSHWPGWWTRKIHGLMHEYAHAARAPLLAAIESLKETLHDEIDCNLRLREMGGAKPSETMTGFLERVFAERDQLLAEIERLRACIAEVREHAEYIVGADWPSSVRRLHARDTLAILDGHAADGGGDA